MNDHQKQIFSGFAILLFTLAVGFTVGVLVAREAVDQRLTEAQALLQKIDNKSVKICE